MTSRLLPRALLAAMLLGTTPAAAQAPDPSFVQAHRGAHTVGGDHVFGEETMASFQHAHLVLGSVIELDTKLTKDRVPVVIHDATLDRTTTCEGRVADTTMEELADCRVDVLGAPFGSLGSEPTKRRQRIPTLEQALAFVRLSGATANLEIKNIPTELDYDSTPAFAETVMDVVLASGIPPERIILQSFWPPNLDVAERRMPGAQTAFLTLGQMNAGGPSTAASKGYEWVSPQWPVDAAYVQQAHGLGRKVVPYTLNTLEDVQAAQAAGVDAVITDDPTMARRAIGLADPAMPWRLKARWRNRGGTTRLRSMKVTRVTPGGVIDIACVAKRCPFGSKELATRRLGTVKLTRRLRKLRMRPGDAVRVRLHTPGAIGRAVSFVAQRRGAPKLEE